MFVYVSGNNIGTVDTSSKTRAASSISNKRSRMSSTISETATSRSSQQDTFVAKGEGRNNASNLTSTQPNSTSIVHEKMPNGVCSCGAIGPFPTAGQIGMFPASNQNGAAPHQMAPPAAHSNQRKQTIQPQQLQQQQRHQHQQVHHQVPQQQWGTTAPQHQHHWSSAMVFCPPPLPAPPPPISGQPTFPTSHYWNELAPAVTTQSSSTSSSFPAPLQSRGSKRSLRSQQSSQSSNQYGNQQGNPAPSDGTGNSWIMAGAGRDERNYYQHQKQHWLQQRFLQHQQNYHQLHQHASQPHLQQQVLQHPQPALPPNNNDSLCRGCAEGKCSMPSACSSSVMPLQRQ